MSNRVESLLIECLDRLEQGDSLEQVLTRYPQDAEILRPMLETAVQLNELKLQPTRAAQLASKNAFLDHAAALKDVGAPRPSPWFALRRLLAPVMAVFVIALAGLGVLQVSAGSLPGDTLYEVKLLVENARMALTGDGTALEAELQQERILEIRQLLALGRAAEVRFSGEISAVSEMRLTIAGLVTELTPQTQLTGTPAPGLLAEVNGRTVNGRLLANIVIITGADNPSPTPTPAPTETAVPATPTPTVTQETIEPTPIPTIDATATPALPTETPAPINDDNANDNGDDNDENDDGSNDNSDDGNADDGDDNTNDGGDNDDDGNGNDDNSNDNDDDDNDNDDNDNDNDDDDDDNDNDDN